MFLPVAMVLFLQAPESPARVVEQAKAFLDQGEPKKALDLLAPLAPSVPDASTPRGLAAVYVLRGAAEVQLGKLDEGASSFAQALRLEPDSAPALFNLGRLRLREGKLEEAERHLRRLVELQPQEAANHHLLGVICQERGNLHEARLELERALPAK